MGEITLQEVLCARDLRAASQRRLLAAYGLCRLYRRRKTARQLKKTRIEDL